MPDAHQFAQQLAYIGPGAGFAFIGSFLTLLIALVASLLSLLVWPFRVVWLSLKRRGRTRAEVRKTIILGLDGLDPKLTEQWMDEGKLPNLRRLKEQGYYSRLRTTFPALSPVAWSTFATGVNPGRHNIFDFLNRDLRTYAPELSSAKVRSTTRVLRIGGWRIPLARVSVEMRRKSETFWKILGRSGVPSTILRVPISFPPEKFQGRLLSAMSTPDLRGTQGSFSWFTTNASTDPGSLACEGGVRFALVRDGGGLRGWLPGPDGAKIAFRITDARELEIQGQRLRLRVGEYTPWIRLHFKLGAVTSAHGIVRFLLTAIEPEVALYVTPVEIDPENPALPISYPSHYAVYLAKLLGTFATLGMAEDTWALNEGAIDEDAFLAQSKLIQQEREDMFFSALDNTRRGVVACVFDTTDRVQHMFYRHLEPERDRSRPASPHTLVIEDLYRDMDRIVGRTLGYVDDDTALFVLSDHGFCAFRRGVNLNAWLLRHGYLALLEGFIEGGEYFEGIDWSRTRAYTFGLSGIYLNQRGREAQGIVAERDAGALKAELMAGLTGLLDDSGDIAIQNMYEATAIYNGPYTEAAPDLIVGYASGYRASWSAAVGKVTTAIIEDNSKCWSGDHCVDPAIVPGVLFSNRRFAPGDPGIEDLAPTVLNLFGVAAPRWMEGKTLCAQP